MAKRMLIDATHAEETRVAVVEGNRLEEFDYESAFRKPLKGSIFLAKVTRVEPSLQACFVNYGGNRHGFLPFSEIHPDYFRIPISDREALIEAQRVEMEQRRAAEEAEDEAEFAREHKETEHKDTENKDSAKKSTDNAKSDDASEDDAKPPEEVVTLEGGGNLHDEADDESAEQTENKDEKTNAPKSDDEQEAPKSRSRGRRSRRPRKSRDAESENQDSPQTDEKANSDAQKPAEVVASKEQSTEALDVKAPVPAQAAQTENVSNKDDKENIGNLIVAEDKVVSDEELDSEVNGNVDGGNKVEEKPQGRGRGRYNNRGRNNKSNNSDGTNNRGRSRGRYNNGGKRNMASSARRVEVLGGDGIEGDQVQRPSWKKHYKIQEVVKRGQIMLIQASKEERGNKGAAVTTYLSLPGRYSVLMPNSPRAGGVSRKIANYKERKRMREILSDLSVPEGMSVIMRTAGTSRTKTEIKRDLDYLIRLWNKIRETTLVSTAPELIYEEGNLTKRSIRDIYTRDIEEVLVAGEEGYKETKNFMKMLIPSHAKRVQEYKEEQIPLFTRYQIEAQINEINQPTVKLKSGGSLVIQPTEALVSIDVNSGSSTKERHIEETALKTNLEAADEVARQLRLRDLGGLVVIDFIDMENYRNNSKVERRMRDALAGDRARIQVGRISNFGLMELSRQRLNPSLAEAQHEACTHCVGTGTVHTVDAAAIQALRALEEEGTLRRSSRIIMNLSNKVAIYVLNNKRPLLAEIEGRYGFQCEIRIDPDMPARQYLIEAVKDAPPIESDGTESKTQETTDSTSTTKTTSTTKPAEDAEGESTAPKRTRGRRGGSRNRRGGRNQPRDNATDNTTGNATSQNASETTNTAVENTSENTVVPADAKTEAKIEVKTEIKAEVKTDAKDNTKSKPSRRRPAKTEKPTTEENKTVDSTVSAAEPAIEVVSPEVVNKADDKPAKKPARRARPVKEKAEKVEKVVKAKDSVKAEEKPKKAPARKAAAKKGKTDDSTPVTADKAAEASNDDAPSDAHKNHETVNKAPDTKKKGWWNQLID